MRAIKLAAAGCFLSFAVQAQNFTIGETNKLGYSDSGNSNLLLAQGPYALTKAAKPVSESFWVTTAAGRLILGIYTSGPNNNCRGGSLIAQTAPFTPKSNAWNTQPLTTAPAMPVGKYCLAYLPSDDGLIFRKGVTSGFNNYWRPFTFSPMPASYPTTNVSGPDGYHWSLYATLAPVSATQTPVAVQFNPPSATVSDAASAGTMLAAALVQTSDGQVFNGQGLTITTQTMAGMTSLTSTSIPSNVQVASIASADDGQQSVTVRACENNVCVSGNLPVMVSSAPPPPTLSLAFNPAMPSISQNLSPGSLVANAVATWSNGSPFTGTYAFGAPDQNDGGQFAIDRYTGAITVGSSGLPTSDQNTTQNITVVATQ